jgi:glycerol-1-phosphatase
MTAAPLPAGGAPHDGSLDSASAEPLSRRYDLALLDLDGVVYRGPDPVAGAPAALIDARAAGMRLAFVTNNASRTPEQIVAQLAELGVSAQPDEVVTSAQAAATLVAERVGPGGTVFIVGGDGLRAAIAAAGLVAAAAYDTVPPPQVVVQGFSPDLRYEDLAQAALAVGRGAIWVATNTDVTIPTARGIQPGNGTLVAAVAAATGRRPVVAGKPERALVDEAVARSGATRPLMVGDRLDTDIEGAVRAGMDSLLVLTGITTVADLLQAGPDSRPTYLGSDLSALGTAIPALAELASLPEQRRSGWRAQTDGDTVRLIHDEGTTPDPMDAVRTLVVAAWAAADAGHPLTRVLVPAGLDKALSALGVPADLLGTANRDNESTESGTGARDEHAGR